MTHFMTVSGHTWYALPPKKDGTRLSVEEFRERLSFGHFSVVKAVRDADGNQYDVTQDPVTKGLEKIECP